MIKRPEFDLAKLLAPVSGATFLQEYWEEKPLLISRDQSDYYASLLTLDEIDPLVTVLPPDTVLVVNSDKPVEVADMTRGGTVAAGASLDVVKACQLFAGGGTIIIRDAHERVATLAKLCRSLEREVGAPVKTNLYMTPAHGKGFDTHYDTHDTILLQLAGSKEWSIFDSPVRLPLANQHHAPSEHKPNGAPTMCFVLHAGDFLYIPRGFLHHGRSCDDTSLHATLGVWSYRWADVFLEAMAQLCLSDPAFRRALPIGFGRADFDLDRARKIFADLVSRVPGQANVDPVLRRLADEFIVGRRAVVLGQLKQVAAAQALSLDDEIGVRPNVIFGLYREGGLVRIRAHGRDIQLPAAADDAVSFALANERYRVRALPGDIDDDDRLTIAKRLIEEGVLWKLAIG
ncbi:MAG: cupin domain-containing protein [Xanthobacteraceae bacterium]